MPMLQNVLHVSLFRATHLGCPKCNAGKSHFSSFSTQAHQRAQNGTFIGYQCEHEFSLYEALKSESKQGIFGTLNLYAHDVINVPRLIDSGKIVPIEINIPEGLFPFATFIAPFSSGEHTDVHISAKSLGFQKNILFVSAPATHISLEGALGKSVKANIAVYLTPHFNTPGWQSLFFNSLTDFTEHRHSLSVFKLATAIEIFADACFEQYLDTKGIAGSMQRLLVSTARSWDAREKRTTEMLASLLTSEESRIFSEALAGFRKNVRNPRNDFAHSQPTPLDHQAARLAYESSFDILWCLGRLADRLNGFNYATS